MHYYGRDVCDLRLRIARHDVPGPVEVFDRQSLAWQVASDYESRNILNEQMYWSTITEDEATAYQESVADGRGVPSLRSGRADTVATPHPIPAEERSAAFRDLLREFAAERGLPLNPVFLNGQSSWPQEDRDELGRRARELFARMNQLTVDADTGDGDTRQRVNSDDRR